MDAAVLAVFCREVEKQADADRHLRYRFKALRQELDEHGQLAGTGHKRIVIPKSKFTETDINSLGFVPVSVAIPESGQTSSRSFRHPNNNYHIHEHGENWTMHEDQHPAATMLVKKRLMESAAAKHKGPPPTVLHRVSAKTKAVGGAVSDMVRGAPHAVTEGVPGMYYYVKGGLAGVKSTAARVQEELPKAYNQRVKKWRDRPQPKVAGVPGGELPDRPEVPGLKVPRLATPRLNPEIGTTAPSNPFRGNWQKLSSRALTSAEAVGLGMLTAAVGAYSLKKTKDQLVNPTPGGVPGGSLGAIARQALLGGRVLSEAAQGYD